MSVSIDVDITVECSVCGNKRELFEGTSNFGHTVYQLEPCQDCIDAAYQKGVSDTEE